MSFTKTELCSKLPIGGVPLNIMIQFHGENEPNRLHELDMGSTTQAKHGQIGFHCNGE